MGALHILDLQFLHSVISCCIKVQKGLPLWIDRVCPGILAVTWWREQVCGVVLHNGQVLIKPHAGSGVVRIDPLHFLAECHKRWLNQVLSVFYLSMLYIVLLFIRAPFYVLLVFVGICSVFWLFWLSCQYLPSDWLERFFWGSLTVARGSSP